MGLLASDIQKKLQRKVCCTPGQMQWCIHDNVERSGIGPEDPWLLRGGARFKPRPAIVPAIVMAAW
jgi:hypothetical protein